MYHSGRNPLRRITRDGERVRIPKGLKVRRLHKAFLRYHDAENWPMLRDALRRMGRADLIGNGTHQLVPAFQPRGTGQQPEGRRRPAQGQERAGTRRPAREPGTTPFRTQHTGLPDAQPAGSGPVRGRNRSLRNRPR
jgi:hypothetical protein